MERWTGVEAEMNLVLELLFRSGNVNERARRKVRGSFIEQKVFKNTLELWGEILRPANPVAATLPIARMPTE